MKASDQFTMKDYVKFFFNFIGLPAVIACFAVAFISKDAGRLEEQIKAQYREVTGTNWRGTAIDLKDPRYAPTIDSVYKYHVYSPTNFEGYDLTETSNSVTLKIYRTNGFELFLQIKGLPVRTLNP